MSPLHRNCHRSPERTGWSHRRGFTLVELTISLVILTASLTVLSGLVMAVGQAWDHSAALEEGRQQSQSAIGRIRWMMQQAGTYRLSGRSTTIGIATVNESWIFYQTPSILVIWSGGDRGGMASNGVLSRPPIASELVVYGPDPNTPSLFVETTFPGNSTPVDFRSTSFESTINSLRTSTSRKSVKLIDRLRVTTGQKFGWLNAPSIGNSRFELAYSPTDTQITSTTAGSQAWNDLPWGQGMVGADYGLRTINLRMELQLERNPKKPTTDSGYSTAMPFFGSANRQFVFQK